MAVGVSSATAGCRREALTRLTNDRMRTRRDADARFPAKQHPHEPRIEASRHLVPSKAVVWPEASRAAAIARGAEVPRPLSDFDVGGVIGCRSASAENPDPCSSHV